MRISPVLAMSQVEETVVMGMTGEPDGPPDGGLREQSLE